MPYYGCNTNIRHFTFIRMVPGQVVCGECTPNRFLWHTHSATMESLFKRFFGDCIERNQFTSIIYIKWYTLYVDRYRVLFVVNHRNELIIVSTCTRVPKIILFQTFTMANRQSGTNKLIIEHDKVKSGTTWTDIN